MHRVLVELVNYAIKKKGILDSQLAIRLGVSESHMYSIRNGLEMPSARNMFQLIELLELEPVLVAILSINKSNTLKLDDLKNDLKDIPKPNPRKVQAYINAINKAFRDTKKTNIMFDATPIRDRNRYAISHTPVEKSQW